MNWSRPALDLGQLRVYPLADRRSLSAADEILVDPAARPAPQPARVEAPNEEVADQKN